MLQPFSDMQIAIITNPNSRKNKGRSDRVSALQDIVGDHGTVHQTQSTDEIKPLLREFLQNKAEYWVADGGDGALHWMLRAAMEIFEEQGLSANDELTLPIAMLPTKGGTIDFVAHNVGLQQDTESLLVNLRAALERGAAVKESLIDSIAISGLQEVDGKVLPFRTFGFAVAACGVGQKFFEKYYDHSDPNPKTIVKIVANALASMPAAVTPLKKMPGASSLGRYASDLFAPVNALVEMDGTTLPHNSFTGVHVASMSLNLGGVFHLFPKADQPGKLHALVGAPSAMTIVKNLPRMAKGKALRGNGLIDQTCENLFIRSEGKLLAPIIDGEVYENVREMTLSLGPRIRVPLPSSDS